MGIDLGPTLYSGTGVEKLMNETQKTPAPVVVSDSLQLADTLVVKTDSSLVQKKDTLKTVAKKEEKTPVASTSVPKGKP